MLRTKTLAEKPLCSLACALLTALTLSACSGGGKSTTVTAPATSGSPSVTARTSALAAGDAVCTSGGILVETGIDSNNNGVLDAGEVSKSQSVCNGAVGTSGATGTSGSDGLSALVKLSQEAPGANCPTGGVRIDSGIDTSNNGILDTIEISANSYTCNGATGPAGPAGSGISWIDVTAATVQAAPNTGYMADSSSKVTITLPASPALGDTVQVTGIGSGGWKVAQNAGQSVITRDIPGTYGAIWTQQGSAKSWSSVASSSDGTKLVAGVSVITAGQLYTSTDSGVTWTARESARQWSAVASSSDGSKLVAVVQNGLIYTSTDSGVTWIPRGIVRPWNSVASSGDGTKLVAAAGTPGGGSGLIYTSSDSGVTWIPHEPAIDWVSVASSADGTRLVASGFSGVYTSADSGTTWTQSSLTQRVRVASSSDGIKVVGVDSYFPIDGRGHIYTSVDAGVTWTDRGLPGNWYSVASSSDGTKLTAVAISSGFGPPAISGQIYTSTDSGVTWFQKGPVGDWRGVASSSDGTSLVAVGSDVPLGAGRIYTSVQGTSTGIGGSIGGGKYDAITLQYIGSNNFTILSHSGDLIVQ